MNAHDTPSGTRMMCAASVNAICARAHGTGFTATRASAAAMMLIAQASPAVTGSFPITPEVYGELLLHPLDVATVRGERPDHGDRDHDDRDAPDRVPREPRERTDPTDDREDHADRARPHRAGEDPEPGEHHDDPDDEVDPTPGRPVELEHVLGALHVEGVVDDPDQAGDGLERTEQDHHEACERDPACRPGAALTF